MRSCCLTLAQVYANVEFPPSQHPLPPPEGERQEAGTPEDDPEARFLRAAQDLRQLADGTSEHGRLLESLKARHEGDLRR